ncbi:hypothetical protein LI328DRAFT_126815, partial [Trichoderma asperelloides]
MPAGLPARSTWPHLSLARPRPRNSPSHHCHIPGYAMWFVTPWLFDLEKKRKTEVPGPRCLCWAFGGARVRDLSPCGSFSSIFRAGSRA